jgi:hypothetical protein
MADRTARAGSGRGALFDFGRSRINDPLEPRKFLTRNRCSGGALPGWRGDPSLPRARIYDCLEPSRQGVLTANSYRPVRRATTGTGTPLVAGAPGRACRCCQLPSGLVGPPGPHTTAGPPVAAGGPLQTCPLRQQGVWRDNLIPLEDGPQGPRRRRVLAAVTASCIALIPVTVWPTASAVRSRGDRGRPVRLGPWRRVGGPHRRRGAPGLGSGAPRDQSVPSPA